MTNTENTEPYYADDEPEGYDTYDGPDGDIDEQYDEAIELFGGGPIPKIGEPREYFGEGGYTASAEIPPEELEKMRRMRPELFTAEYTYTYTSLSEDYKKALIEKYGHIPELNHMVAVDEQPDD